jgi:spectrin beta
MFLRERLKALKDGWDEIHQMWENRQKLLSQSLSLQLLDKDARQAEVILNQQEHTLSKIETPTNLEQADNQLKKHESFLTSMEANDDKFNAVIQFTNRLIDEGHFASDKIAKRADNIDQRRIAIKEKALALMERLRDQLELQQFLRDCDELGEWIQEKHITAQDETYRSAKTVHSKWTRHQAFEAEIAANKERLLNLQKTGEELAKEKPEFADVIKPKIEELADQFDVLEQTTKEKGERLFDANREVLIHQTCDDIDSWMNDLEKQIESDDTGSDLASVNILMQKQQVSYDFCELFFTLYRNCLC